MTSRQRVLTALSRNLPDKVPMDIAGFNREAFKIFQEKTDSDNPEEYFNLDFRWVFFKPTRIDLNQFRKFHSDLPPTATFNEWGTAFIPGEEISAFDHFIAPLTQINSVKALEEYPLPDIMEDYRHKDLEGEVLGIKGRDFAVVGWMPMTIFEVAWQIRGFDELLTDFTLNEKYAQCLLDRITELRCRQARRYAESGIDILHIGDDVGMQDRLIISPDLWRKWLKERLGKVIASALNVNPDLFIFYHSDGYIEPIIPDLIDIGINVLNPVQPECMDPVRLKRMFGNRLAFWGTIGTQTTMPFGLPDEVKRTVKGMIETVGKGGGLMIAPTHVLEPEVPWENVMAFVDAVEEYGRY